MTIVGEKLIAPELGWRRIDNTDSKFSYIGKSWKDYPYDGFYGGTAQHSYPVQDELNMQIKFKFKGSKLRIIAQMNEQYSKNIEIKIDGNTDSYSEYAPIISDGSSVQKLVYEKLNLQNTTHSVEITKLSIGNIQLDAIDIDEDGYLVDLEDPDNPSVPITLLRVTMIDSSVRDYQLGADVIEGFVNWYTHHIGTDTTAYCLTKKVGQQESKEYLTFDKIISFEVITI